MSKKWTRRGALGAMAGGAGLLAWGSGGFTNISADRETAVDATADPGGLLGIRTLDDQLIFETETRDLIEVSNNTGETLDTVSASVTNEGSLSFDIDVVDTPDSLDAGDAGTVSATVTGCGDDCEAKTGPVEFELFASSASGSVSSIEATREVGMTCVNCLNFQKPSTTTPTGFVPDAGDAFGLRDEFDDESTLEYGWSRDQTTETRKRNTVTPTEEDTLNHFIREARIPTEYDVNEDGFWEFDLPEGEYDVTLRCHDPDYLDQEYSFDISGGTDEVRVRDDEFDDETNERNTNDETYNFAITVDPDAMLRIKPPYGTYNPKIAWIRFRGDADADRNSANFDVSVTDVNDPVTGGGKSESFTLTYTTENRTV